MKNWLISIGIVSLVVCVLVGIAICIGCYPYAAAYMLLGMVGIIVLGFLSRIVVAIKDDLDMSDNFDPREQSTIQENDKDR